MPAAPIPNYDAKRLAALVGCNVLDTGPEPGFDDLTALAARLCDTPIALVSLVDKDRQWFKSKVGVDVEQTPREQAFCGYAILGDEPLIIQNATQDPRTVDNPLVTEAPAIRFYAGVPLRLSTGEALGTLCVIDLKPRTLTDDQLSDLCALAGQASSQLELRMQAQRALAAHDEAVRASQAKSSFLANMSHEIRTPMTAILGYADLMGRGIESNTKLGQEAITAIRSNANHLLAIINDILDMSKIEAGKMQTERIWMRPVQLIEEVASHMSTRAEEKNLSLRVVYNTPVPEQIKSDPTRVKQILLNLVSNAVKFTEQGSIEIHVTHQANQQALGFKVIDSGIGMTPEQLAITRQFDAFRQADNSTTRRFGGTGLGLRISHALTSMLGQPLQIESTQDKGSVFGFLIDTDDLSGIPVLPADQIVETAKGTNTSTASSISPSSAKVLSGRKILLAEDGIDNQRLLRYLLSQAGAVVTVVGNGQAAIDAVEACPADAPFTAVLMDMQMPICDGYEATKRLRERGCSLPIIALTANAMDGDSDECLLAGCDDYLSKPIDQTALIKSCSQATHTRTVSKAI